MNSRFTKNILIGIGLILLGGFLFRVVTLSPTALTDAVGPPDGYVLKDILREQGREKTQGQKMDVLVFQNQNSSLMLAIA